MFLNSPVYAAARLTKPTQQLRLEKQQCNFASRGSNVAAEPSVAAAATTAGASATYLLGPFHLSGVLSVFFFL
jgi:hypothetical protein